MAEFILEQLSLICEIPDVSAHQLTQAQVLVKSGRCLIFALQDVAEAGTESDLPPPIEVNLAARQI